jgi:hypothetical protein
MTEATQRKENTHNRACRVAQGPDPWTEVQWIVHGYRIGISQGSSLGGPGVFSQAPPRGPPFLPGQQLPGPGLPRLTHHPGPPPGWTRASSLDCSRLKSLNAMVFSCRYSQTAISFCHRSDRPRTSLSASNPMSLLSITTDAPPRIPQTQLADLWLWCALPAEIGRRAN